MDILPLQRHEENIVAYSTVFLFFDFTTFALVVDELCCIACVIIVVDAIYLLGRCDVTVSRAQLTLWRPTPSRSMHFRDSTEANWGCFMNFSHVVRFVETTSGMQVHLIRFLVMEILFEAKERELASRRIQCVQ